MLWGRSTFPTILRPCCHGYVNHIIDFACRIDFLCSQGTKVLEDREIRLDLFLTSEDAPPQSTSDEIVKYTGTLVSPKWKDVTKGAVFTP